MASAPQAPQEDELIVGINVTPLVDVVLVLLIVFLLSAQLVNTPAISVALPHARSGEPPAGMPLDLTLRADGALFINDAPVTMDALPRLLSERLAARPDLQATIFADTQVPHGRVVALIDTLERAGIGRFALGVDASDAATAGP